MPNTETIQDYDEIFTDDKLDIKSNVIDFAHLIEQDTHKTNQTSKVYSISAEFGIGKTFFCDKLLQVLAKDKVKVGKLNIWEMDFYDNPLIPILAELNKLYSSKGKNLPCKIIDVISNLGEKASSTVVEAAAYAGYNCAVNKIKQISGYPDIVNLIEGADVWNICKENQTSNTIYDDYTDYRNALDELKDLLKKWAFKQKDKPIVIIIDELDRCKPDYAIKTLEILKHIFDIPGFVFVLAIDEEQLKNSVQTLFGTINYEGYKRKFINNSFKLPEPNKLAFTEYLYEKSGINEYIEQIQKDKRELVFAVSIRNVYFCSHSYSDYGNRNKQEIAQEFNQQQTSEKIIIRYFASYSDFFNFSLRKMEQVFDRLTLFVKQISLGKEIFSPDLAVFLICLHEGDIKIFDRVRKIQNCSKSIWEELFETAISSVAYQIYKDEAFSKFKKINRKIAPEVIPVAAYSYLMQQGNGYRIIQDNVDRFYISSPDVWLFQHDAINTYDVLNNGDWDREKFKENYCKHIDFITHFE